MSIQSPGYKCLPRRLSSFHYPEALKSFRLKLSKYQISKCQTTEILSFANLVVLCDETSEATIHSVDRNPKMIDSIEKWPDFTFHCVDILNKSIEWIFYRQSNEFIGMTDQQQLVNPQLLLKVFANS